MRPAAIPSLFACLLLLAMPGKAQWSAMDRDGWYTWQVDAVADAPSMCCYRWRLPTAADDCDLDRERGFNIRRDREGDRDALRLYARVDAGHVVELRTYSASCPVRSAQPINDLGEVSADNSAERLATLIVDRAATSSDTLASLAFHAGPAARGLLDQAARSHTDSDLRGEAWFWVAQRADADAADSIFRALSEDRDDDVREQAVFALSQLPGERSVAALIRVVEASSLGVELRKNALFWLGQSESDAAFAYLDELISSN